MKKILIAILILGAGALIYYLVGGNKDVIPEGVEVPEDVSVEDVENALKEEGDRKVVASCKAIEDKSSCTDFIGSMWESENVAELACEGVGEFAKGVPCPQSEFGGCQVSGGTVMETITWAYREGPGEYNEETIPFAIGACNANSQANWVK